MKAVTRKQMDQFLAFAGLYDPPENTIFTFVLTPKEFEQFQLDNIGKIKFDSEIEYNSSYGVNAKIVKK